MHTREIGILNYSLLETWNGNSTIELAREDAFRALRNRAGSCWWPIS